MDWREIRTFRIGDFLQTTAILIAIIAFGRLVARVRV